MGRWTPRVHARVVPGPGSTLELPGGVGWFQIVTNYSIFGGQRQSVSKLNNFFCPHSNPFLETRSRPTAARFPSNPIVDVPKKLISAECNLSSVVADCSWLRFFGKRLCRFRDFFFVIFR